MNNDNLLQEKYNSEAEAEINFECENTDCQKTIFNSKKRIFSFISSRFLCESCYQAEENNYYLQFDQIIQVACLTLTQALTINSLDYLADKISYINNYHTWYLDSGLKNIETELKEQLYTIIEFYQFPKLLNTNFFDIASKLAVYILFFQVYSIKDENLYRIIVDSILILFRNEEISFSNHQRTYLNILSNKILQSKLKYQEVE